MTASSTLQKLIQSSVTLLAYWALWNRNWTFQQNLTQLKSPWNWLFFTTHRLSTLMTPSSFLRSLLLLLFVICQQPRNSSGFQWWSASFGLIVSFTLKEQRNKAHLFFWDHFWISVVSYYDFLELKIEDLIFKNIQKIFFKKSRFHS